MPSAQENMLLNLLLCEVFPPATVAPGAVSIVGACPESLLLLLSLAFIDEDLDELGIMTVIDADGPRGGAFTATAVLLLVNPSMRSKGNSPPASPT